MAGIEGYPGTEGYESYVRDPVTGEWGPPGTKLNGMPNAWDQPFDLAPQRQASPVGPGPKPQMTMPPESGRAEFATPQGGQLRVINTPDSSRGTPFQRYPGVPATTPTQQGNPLTTTPSSRTGAPAPGIRNLPISGPLGTAVSVLANGPTTDEDFYKQVGGASRWFDQSALGKWLIEKGITSPTPEWGPPTAAAAPAATAPVPYTGQGPGRSPSGPVPPGPPTDTPLPPFNRGPIPYNLPPNGPIRVPLTQQRPRGGGGGGGRGRGGGGGGGGGAQAAPPMVNLQPQPGWTTIDRPNADIAGGRSVAGQLAPQYFTPAHTPGGPAQMGAFDFSTLFNHPQVAAAAAQHPAVQAAANVPMRAAPARRPVRGPLAPGALGQGQQPGRVDPEIWARSQLPLGRIDPEIVARQGRGFLRATITLNFSSRPR